MSKKIRSADAVLKVKATKVLRALNKMGCTEVAYTQVLEALARSEGARTLHVHEARKPIETEPKALATLARGMAADLFFLHRGEWMGRETELMGKIQELMLLEDDSANNRSIEAGWEELQGRNPVELKEPYDRLRLQEWPKAFEGLVHGLIASLTRNAEVKGDGATNQCLHAGVMYDWRVGEDGLPANHPDASPYSVVIGRNQSSNQFYVDICPPNTKGNELGGTPQMSLFVEINEGVPCVHMTNEIYGDQVLSVFFTPDGLYLRPDGPTVDSRSAPEGLQRLHEKLHAHYAENGAASRIPADFLYMANKA